jgi:hypothetical protein
VEDVVKAQCRLKADNHKLAQVGAMYDVAHSKGAIHVASRTAMRLARDKARARDSRIATRKKNWERRHLSREIVRKQDKKNREKRARKENKDTMEAKAKEEKEPKDIGIQTEDVKVVQIVKEDKAMQTEDPLEVAAVESTLPASKDTGNGVQTIEPWQCQIGYSHSTPETPNSNTTSIGSPPHLLRIPGGPPPPPPPPSDFPGGPEGSIPQRNPRGRPRPQYITSDGESSASPISDFDDLYSDDDHTLKPRPVNTEGTPGKDSSKRSKASDDEDEIEPWNAVCIVGFRVYSKDKGLEVRIVDETSQIDNAITEGQHEDGTDADVEEVGDKAKREDSSERTKQVLADVDSMEMPTCFFG